MLKCKSKKFFNKLILWRLVSGNSRLHTQGSTQKGVCTADCGLSADEVTLSSMTLVIARAELAVTTNYLMRIS